MRKERRKESRLSLVNSSNPNSGVAAEVHNFDPIYGVESYALDFANKHEVELAEVYVEILELDKLFNMLPGALPLPKGARIESKGFSPCEGEEVFVIHGDPDLLPHNQLAKQELVIFYSFAGLI